MDYLTNLNVENLNNDELKNLFIKLIQDNRLLRILNDLDNNSYIKLFTSIVNTQELKFKGLVNIIDEDTYNKLAETILFNNYVDQNQENLMEYLLTKDINEINSLLEKVDITKCFLMQENNFHDVNDDES